MSRPDLAGLVGARICHDLISPIGAIGNGVELLGLSGPPSPELKLISESVAGASAKVKFLRIAFGRSEGKQEIRADEVRAVLREAETGTRFTYDWQVTETPNRAEVRCAFLAIQCLQTAMPMGGQVTISASGGVWHLFGLTGNLRIEESQWAWLNGTNSPDDVLLPASVQFALLPEVARSIGRTAKGAETPDGISITF